MLGWWSHKMSSRFQMTNELDLDEGAAGYRISNPPIHLVAPLMGSLEVFNSVSMDDLRSRSCYLTGYMEFLIKHFFDEASPHRRSKISVKIITPAEFHERGCQLSLRFSVPIDLVYKELTKRGVAVDKRYPHVIRVAPIHLYNNYTDVRRFITALQVVVLSVKGDKNGRSFVTEFENRRHDYGVHVQHYIDVDPNNVPTLSSSFEVVTSNIVLLYAGSEIAEKIFNDLKNTTISKVWLINEDASYSKNLPRGSKPFEISLPKHLRAVTVNDPPFVYSIPASNPNDCQGLGEVEVPLSGIDTASVPNSSIDRSFQFSLHLNDSYGAVVVSHDSRDFSLSGALWELDNDKADLAIGGMSVNPEREHYVDFSEPWLYHGIKILEKSQNPSVSTMQSFLQPLQSSLWTALFVAVALIGLAIYLLDLSSPFHKFYSPKDETEDPFSETQSDAKVNFGESMWFVWGVLLNSGVSEKTPRGCAARVLGLVWCGFCMIIAASYTANLAAFLVLDQPEKGLSGITDPRVIFEILNLHP
ncbi:hypothetical protein WR25_18810 isoform A [Diploscapter pachys]|nr:hypothetical protein WR25_18810 isoform A [Diploscapter pachys]